MRYIITSLALVASVRSALDRGLSWTCVASSIQSLDFIVNPGAVGTHTHVIWGGDATAPTVESPDGMRQSTCTSCSAAQDFSAYWQPYLYAQLTNDAYLSLPEPEFRYSCAS